MNRAERSAENRRRHVNAKLREADDRPVDQLWVALNALVAEARRADRLDGEPGCSRHVGQATRDLVDLVAGAREWNEAREEASRVRNHRVGRRRYVRLDLDQHPTWRRWHRTRDRSLVEELLIIANSTRGGGPAAGKR